MKLRTAAISAIVILAANQASAANYHIYKPQVEQGEVEIEAYLNYSADNDAAKDRHFRQQYGVGYGVTDFWKSELSFNVDKANNSVMELEEVKWENIFVPFKQGQYFVDAGLYLELEKAWRNNEPDNFEGKILLYKQIDKFEAVANIGAEHQFGPHHSDKWEGILNARLAYRLNPMFEPGLEYFGKLGAIDDMPSHNEQDHRFGPVVTGKFSHNVAYDTGVLFGVSDAADDVTFKLNLEYEF